LNESPQEKKMISAAEIYNWWQIFFFFFFFWCVCGNWGKKEGNRLGAGAMAQSLVTSWSGPSVLYVCLNSREKCLEMTRRNTHGIKERGAK
jgi:fatty acid desaturase